MVSDQKIVDRADLQKFTKDELIDYILAVSFMLRRPPLSPITALHVLKRINRVSGR